MTRISTTQPSGRSVLLVDDSIDYLQATRLLLEREGHDVSTASSGREALDLLKKTTVDLLLLDFFMPGMTGEEVVRELRTFDPMVQVILQTGYSGERPAREMMRKLDIQGYYDKSEGPDKLLLWTDVGLKAAWSLQAMAQSRQGLRYILDVTPDLHRIQPLTGLLQGILVQVAGLLGAVDSFLAVRAVERPADDKANADSFVAMVDDESDLVIQAGTGRFSGNDRVSDVVGPERFDDIHRLLERGDGQSDPDTTIVALTVGELNLGVIYLDRPVRSEQDRELLSVFANQAAVAIQNVQLYELATLDQLTGLFVRSFFDKWLQRELRTAFRSQQSLSLVMVDIDGLKQINDQSGHVAGDHALALAGDVLRQATRDTDIVGRVGGDEFAIILPGADADGVRVVGERIAAGFRSTDVAGEPVRASIGGCVLGPHIWPGNAMPRTISPDYFVQAALALRHSADGALYASKFESEGALHMSSPIDWPAELDSSAAPDDAPTSD